MPRQSGPEQKEKKDVKDEKKLERQPSITFAQLPVEEQNEQLVIDSMTQNISEIHQAFRKARTEIGQDTTPLTLSLSRIVAFFEEAELRNQINSIKRLSEDQAIKDNLKSLESSIEGFTKEGRPGVKFIDIDEITKRLKTLSNSIIKYLKVEIPEQTSKEKPKF